MAVDGARWLVTVFTIIGYGFHMPYLGLGGERMFFSVHGAKTRPSLLFVHGWGGEGAQWLEVIEMLAGRRELAGRMIVPDLRGHGASRCPRPAREQAGPASAEERFFPREYARDLAVLLAELDAAPVVAVGHSMGGQVVTALAVEHPGSVASLVVLDPAYGASEEEMARLPGEQAALLSEGSAWAARSTARAFSSRAPAWVREREVRQLDSMDPRVLAAARHGMYLAPDAFGARAASAAYLSRCPAPTLGIYSNEPAAEWHRARAVRHPASEVVVVPDSGHYLHLEWPARVAALLARWCR
jgi:pimeloyl-ACP methyl ester carboxylesterase